MKSCETSSVERSRRRWFQFSSRQVFLIAAALLAFLLGIGFHFRTHLYLRYAIASGRLPEAKPIPTRSMPDTSEPEGWVSCRFGSLQFRLPPQMAASEETHENSTSILVFQDGPRSVLVKRPESIADTEEFLQSDLKMPRQGSGLSRPRLRLAWCQASSSDFRWSMSQNELAWHAWCINMNSLCRLQPDGWAETMFGGDLDGLLVIRQNRQLAIFDWQSNKQAMGAYIRFRDMSAEPDLEWVRCVCKSIRVCEVP